jgi:hypothetical protein
VVAFQPVSTSTPSTALRPQDQPELLAQGRRVPRRSRPDAARAEDVEANFEVTAEAGELGVLTVTSALFHGS